MDSKMMYFIYGECNDGCGGIIWQVGVVNSESQAKQMCKYLKDKTTQLFNEALAQGFERTDAINIKNPLDPNAQYGGFQQHNDEWRTDTHYYWVEVPVIDNFLQYEEQNEFTPQPHWEYPPEIDWSDPRMEDRMDYSLLKRKYY